MKRIGIAIKSILNNRKNPWLWLGLGVFLVIIAAVVMVMVVKSKQNQQLTANDQSIFQSRGSDPQIGRVSLAEAKSAFDNQQAVFVDVRSSASFSASHIPGSINIPLARILDRYQDLNPSRWIILYCTWPEEQSSARAAALLQNHGFKQVNALLGGFAAWQSANFPVEPAAK